MRRFAVLWALLTLVIAAVVGVAAYQFGLHNGLSQQIQNLPANNAPAPGYPYWYGPHWGYGFGFFPFFPLFPLFPFFGLLFFLLILFLLVRPRRWYGGGPWGSGPGGPGRPGAHLEEWHRREHEAEARGETPGGSPAQ